MDQREQRCALIFEHPTWIYHAQGRSLKGMRRNSKIIGPWHQLKNETLTTQTRHGVDKPKVARAGRYSCISSAFVFLTKVAPWQ